MAINKYYTPKQSQYLPAIFDVYQDYYQKQDAAYEQGQSTIDKFYTTLGSLKAFGAEDDAKLLDRKNYYEGRLNELIESSNGKPMQMLPGLRELNREFVNDFSSGPLADINRKYGVAAEDYERYKTKTAEGKYDPWRQAIAKKMIGTGQIIGDSPDKMKFLKENFNDVLAENMPFNDIVSLATQTLMSDPNMQQEASMVRDAFGDEGLSMWQNNVLETAKAGAVSKYKYDAKLLDTFEKQLSTGIMKGAKNETEMMQKASEAFSNAMDENGDFIQSLNQIYKDPKVTQAFIDKAQRMAINTARKNWDYGAAALAATGDEESARNIIRSSKNYMDSGRVFPNKVTGQTWRNTDESVKGQLAKEFAERNGLTNDYASEPTTNWISPSYGEKSTKMSRVGTPKMEIPTSNASSAIAKDIKYANSLSAIQSIPSGLRPKTAMGDDLTEWDVEIFGDAKHTGDLANKKIWVSSPDGAFQDNTGESNYALIAEQLGIKGDSDAETRGNLAEAMAKQRDKGLYYPAMWNGQEWMYGVVVYNMPSKEKGGDEFQVAVQIDEPNSNGLKQQFGEVFDAMGMSEVAKRQDFISNNGQGMISDYKGIGDYSVSLKDSKIPMNFSTSTKENKQGIITGFDVKSTPKRDPNTKDILRDPDDNIIYETKIKLQVVDENGNQIDDDEFEVDGFDTFVNSLMSAHFDTLKNSGDGSDYVKMLHLKPSLVLGKKNTTNVNVTTNED